MQASSSSQQGIMYCRAVAGLGTRHTECHPHSLLAPCWSSCGDQSTVQALLQVQSCASLPEDRALLVMIMIWVITTGDTEHSNCCNRAWRKEGQLMEHNPTACCSGWGWLRGP